ncbi:ferredoxin [Synergistales bacterium]|nr:ferredoxin [Synergistales bacterium]
MDKNRKRILYRGLSWGRFLAALGILVLFIMCYLGYSRVFYDVSVNDNLLWRLTRSQITVGLIALDSVVFLLIFLVSIIAGRWYCSVLCPFGSLQETVWRVARFFKSKIFKKRYRYISPSALRYIVPTLAGVGLAFSLPYLFIPLSPLGSFGRGVRTLYVLAIDGISSLTLMMSISLMFFAFVLVLAAMRGRRFCDWCPAGILLGVCANAAPMRIRLDEERCVLCGSCEYVCPMNCVDLKNKTLDNDRCVLCMSCAAACPKGALSYGMPKPKERESRRAFLRDSSGILAFLSSCVYVGGATLSAISTAREREEHKIAAAGEGFQHPILQDLPIAPPGADNAKNFLSHCIGCQACAAVCPAEVIRFNSESGLHPRLDYTKGYCQYNCKSCLDVCPTDALRDMSIEEKHITRIGISFLNHSRCVVVTKGQSCGACAEVCPTHALRMAPLGNNPSLTAPVFDPEYCIGCGGCFNVCPAEPRAFVVSGVHVQTQTPGIRPSDDNNEELFKAGDDFPF